MTGKGQTKRHYPAGVDYISIVTNQTDVPSAYFAGVRQLNVSWVMNPVIAFTKPSNTSGKGK